MLAFDGVGKRHGRSWALRDVSLELRTGRRVAVVGPNAAGKTTLLDLASGLARPSEGRLLLDGEPVDEDRTDVKARVGYVGHDPGLYGALTVQEMLAFHAAVHELDADDRIDVLVDRFDLAARRHDRIDTLSRGLLQRTALAYALVPDPPVLLLDEPYTGLDVDAARRLTELLDATRDRLVVVTAHDVSDVPDPDRVVLLDDGQVAFEGSPGEAEDAQAKVYGGIR